ncbi:hypothetical protein [Ectothiorhodospira variabilis]|uniref:RipA family octameric membrane protein n=1 Tax=Ectothiorhodospira variabilis TaxID=505694 RepID=UPI001EFB7FB0|nr:hypothetical protein [Ectothiorhodospira variabilis]MCG5496033.1 hypothetical protein [Ectothiorhodospira variabilis]MCG5505401.1 hypothetical protein [Ectothiorhodospira variabilis]MCG5508587.1 hypothetical protein [Ectothiorhodospira variabilis]
MEIELFWKRSGYFMALNTAIAVGFFSIDDRTYAGILAFVGAAVCLIWYFVTLGSKFWQSRWEERARQLEEELNGISEQRMRLFSASWEELRADVQASLDNNEHKQFRKFFNWQVMKKPSVSFQMSLLSLAFFLFWIAVFVVHAFVAQPVAAADPCFAALRTVG